jgi:hypothetical protein
MLSYQGHAHLMYISIRVLDTTDDRIKINVNGGAVLCEIKRRYHI